MILSSQDFNRCTAVTRRGLPCRGKQMSWGTGVAGPVDPMRCRSHLSAEQRSVRLELSQRETSWPALLAVPATPACWAWPVPHEAVALVRQYQDERRTGERSEQHNLLPLRAMELFAQGRCAICGRPDVAEVEDHDHWTGLVRGWLCRSCNTREGLNRDGDESVWARYRLNNPYSILGIVEHYDGGWGWEFGRPSNSELYSVDPADRWRDNAMKGAFT